VRKKIRRKNRAVLGLIKPDNHEHLRCLLPFRTVVRMLISKSKIYSDCTSVEAPQLCSKPLCSHKQLTVSINLRRTESADCFYVLILAKKCRRSYRECAGFSIHFGLRTRNEFPEFIPSLQQAKVFLQSVEKSQWRNRFVDNMAVRNVLQGQKRHLFPLSCYPVIRIYIRFTLKTALKLTSARMLLAISLADSANIQVKTVAI